MATFSWMFALSAFSPNYIKCFDKQNFNQFQRAKKVVPDSPGLVDFVIGLVIFVLNLPDAQVMFWGEIQITVGL